MAQLPNKTSLPVLRQITVKRTGLLQQIQRALEHRVTLVAAPPGYGKTTVVAQFARQTVLPVAWHTVEAREHDLPELLKHCAAVLSAVGRPIDPLPASTPGEAAQQIADHLRDISPGHFLYILDDVHLLMGSPEAEDWLRSFTRNMPSTCHVVLIGRALPPLPMTELVAHGEVLAIGQEQLRFTFQELQTLAGQLGVSRSMQDIHRISVRFAGWPAGSMLALQPLPGDIERILLGGRQGPEALFDALAESMLLAQPGQLQDFLLASSTLTRVTPALCHDALQLLESRERLEEALNQNLFLSQVSGAVVYHPLFRDFLQRYLQAHLPLRFIDLHSRAARWFEANDRLDEAFDHYFTAGLLDESAAIAEGAAPAFLAQGKPETVLDWGRRLQSPTPLVPQLRFLCGTLYAYRYQYDQAGVEFAQAAQAFQAQHDDRGVLKVSLAQSNMDALQGHNLRAVERTETVLRRADLSPNVRGYAHSILGRAYLNLGDLTRALEHLETALPLYRATGDAFAIAHLLLALEIAYTRIGRFAQASIFLHEAMGLLRALGSRAELISPLNNLGYKQHLLGEYEEAMRTFQEALGLVRPDSEKRAESHLLASIGDLQRDRGAYSEALAFYRKALHLIGDGEPALRSAILVSMTTLRRWQGQVAGGRTLAEEANALAQAHGLRFEKMAAEVSLWITRARQGETKLARRELDRLADAYREQPAPLQWSLTRVLCAAIALDQGDLTAAHVYLKSVVEGTAHEANLQPGIAEIIHTPALTSFVQAYRSRFPTLIRGMVRLEAARVELPVRDANAQTVEPVSTLSLKLWALGGERVERDGVPVPLSAWRAANARELFFYLLFKGAATREQLGLILWEDSSPQQVRQKFHTTLHRARDAVGTNAIRFEDDRYFLNPDLDVWCDVVEFETLVHKARLSSPLRAHTETMWRRAVSLYQGELLLAFDDDWIVPHREALQQLFLEALFTLGNCVAGRGDQAEAMSLFQRALQLDPYREDIHRALLTCYAALGERAAIRRQADQLTTLLETDLGTTPSAETLSLTHFLLT